MTEETSFTPFDPANVFVQHDPLNLLGEIGKPIVLQDEAFIYYGSGYMDHYFPKTHTYSFSDFRGGQFDIIISVLYEEGEYHLYVFDKKLNWHFVPIIQNQSEREALLNQKIRIWPFDEDKTYTAIISAFVLKGCILHDEDDPNDQITLNFTKWSPEIWDFSVILTKDNIAVRWEKV